MEVILISGSILFFLSFVNCYSDSESTESNRLEVTPFYDTIIYSDIADVLNDFQNNGFPPIESLFTNSESESDEDLLTEYQHYLEKAHKQRKNYIEKSKPKNKVPLVRHDQFTKTKPSERKRTDFFYPNGFSGPFQLPQVPYTNPLDLLIPLKPKNRYINKAEITTTPREIRGERFPFEKVILRDDKLLDLPPVMVKASFDPIKSCHCTNGNLPCDCNNCKECVIDMDKKHKNAGLPLLPDSNYNMRDFLENTFNIRIKVDLQFPKLKETFDHFKSHNFGEQDDVISKEVSTAMKLPFPFFNVPMPMKVFGFKGSAKYNKESSAPVHKISIHKKKKSRINNNNKKHRNKFITFHNIKLEEQPLFPISLFNNVTDKHTNDNNITNETTVSLKNILQPELNIKINKADDVLNDTLTKENSSVINNTTNKITEENRKIENSIETDFTKILPISNTSISTKLPIIRLKRDISNSSKSINQSNDPLLVIGLAKPNITIKETDSIKKSDKTFLTDPELLYWPNVKRNKTYVSNKNITTMILENEHKKTKLNMSKETIRQNHTKALERAIFGEVDWDDVDTVAPAFMSFVGKYVRGILTFCSHQACHSMKCANKTCIHRVCVPSERLNNKGHCAGSNETDSVASMESIMDLPSNVAFEIVDILQDRMMGKVYGKATFCINAKCITLVASKKTFLKSRCTVKDLTATDHCANAKTVKNV